MDGHALPLGDGVMTITPVMGTALINTYGLMKRTKGAVLVMPAEYRSQLEPGIVATEHTNHLFVNWIRSTNQTISAARALLGISRLSTEDLERLMREAIVRNRCKPDWVAATQKYLGPI
jgi:hypothetical protein